MVINSKKIGCRINSMNALLAMVINCRMISGSPGCRQRLTRYDEFAQLQWVITCVHGHI